MLRKALDAKPDEAIARRLAKILVRENDLQGAIQVYQSALKANPESRTLNLDIARLAQKNERDELALKHYTAALDSARANGRQKKEIYTSRAAIRYKRGDLRRALADYEHALEIAPADKKIAHSIKRIQVELEYRD